MKRLICMLPILVFCAGAQLLTAQDRRGDKGGDKAAADELKQIENDWAAADKAKDAAKLGDILADSWVGIEWDGKTTTKAKALADLNKAGNSLDEIQMGPMTVRFFGDTAIVTGSDTEKSKADGKDMSGKYVWTDVFVKQNGKWKAVASQATKVPK
jgi:ketosteroid isomerase-like protein